MNKGFWLLTVVVLGGLLGQGCDNVGKAPAGPSTEEMKAKIDALPFDKRIEEMLNGPGTPALKKSAIEEAYKKEGKPIPPEIAQKLEGGNPSGAPSGAPAAASGK